MNALLEKNFAAMVIAVAIVLAMAIYAFVTRYQPIPVNVGLPIILDRWTGETRFAESR